LKPLLAETYAIRIRCLRDARGGKLPRGHRFNSDRHILHVLRTFVGGDRDFHQLAGRIRFRSVNVMEPIPCGRMATKHAPSASWTTTLLTHRSATSFAHSSRPSLLFFVFLPQLPAMRYLLPAELSKHGRRAPIRAQRTLQRLEAPDADST
jgi:hypothetical protein